MGGGINAPTQVAGDPIFWLHHANIDRLWEVWRLNSGVGHDATESPYLGFTFTFLAPDGTQTPHTPAGVVSTDSQLHYVYDDTSVPASAGAVTTRGGGALNDNPSQTIGSMQSGLAMVSGQPSDLSIALDPIGSLDDVVNASRLVLMIEHVTAAAQVDTNFGVFVQPAGGGEGVMAGVLPMFGVHEASGDDAEHGLAFVFDVTDVIMRLSQLDQWDPSMLSLQIRSLTDDTDAVEQDWPDVNIGSISMMIA